MNTQSTVEQMQHLKLFGMSKLYQAVLDQPVHQQPEAHTLLGMLKRQNEFRFFSGCKFRLDRYRSFP